MSAFFFEKQNTGKGVHRAELPGGIKSKAVLLDAISVALGFPDYFGGNWDALEECIRDLSWLPAGDVILAHEDLPLAEDRASLSTYLSILKDAVEKWSATGRRKLIVVFPPDSETIVRCVLTEV